MTDISDRVQLHGMSVLSDNWYVLKKADFSWRRSDGTWDRMTREVYDRGNAAVILLYDPATRRVVLTRQFRMPAFVNGYRQMLIEAAAGLLDGEAPEQRIREEAEEETGYRIAKVEKIFQSFMSPGSVTEILHFFVGAYSAADKAGAGGGLAAEGEDIDVLELPFDEAYAMIAGGGIVDAKTIMLLQWAKINLFAA
jgi:nudix-type nucleoside diphosphatase (YffH/AdpP family)